MNELTADIILSLLYALIVMPMIGALFGGNYCTYGENDKYENCFGRGALVHFIALCLYLIAKAVYFKLTVY